MTPHECRMPSADASRHHPPAKNFHTSPHSVAPPPPHTLHKTTPKAPKVWETSTRCWPEAVVYTRPTDTNARSIGHLGISTPHPFRQLKCAAQQTNPILDQQPKPIHNQYIRLYSNQTIGAPKPMTLHGPERRDLRNPSQPTSAIGYRATGERLQLVDSVSQGAGIRLRVPRFRDRAPSRAQQLDQRGKESRRCE